MLNRGAPVMYADSSVHDLRIWLESGKFDELIAEAKARFNAVILIFMENTPISIFEHHEVKGLFSSAADKQECRLELYIHMNIFIGPMSEVGSEGPIIQVHVYSEEACLSHPLYSGMYIGR